MVKISFTEKTISKHNNYDKNSINIKDEFKSWLSDKNLKFKSWG